MANSTKDRATQYAPSALNLPMRDGKLPANGIAYSGTMQSADANGRLKNPGTTTENVRGVAVERADATGLANDAASVNLRLGPHGPFALHATNPPTAADIGKMGYASDNQTISKTSTDGSPAGEIIAVESAGVWIDIGKRPLV